MSANRGMRVRLLMIKSMGLKFRLPVRVHVPGWFQRPRWTVSDAALRRLLRWRGGSSLWPMEIAPIGVNWAGTPNAAR